MSKSLIFSLFTLLLTVLVSGCNHEYYKIIPHVNNGFQSGPPGPSVTLASGTPTQLLIADFTVASCLDISQIFISESLIQPAVTDPGWQSCVTAVGAMTYTLSLGDGVKSVYVYGQTLDGLVTTGTLVNVRLVTTTASLEWSPLSYSFSNVKVGNEAAEHTFTFSNTSTDDAVACEAPELTNTTEFEFTHDDCGVADLNAGDDCTVKVKAVTSAEGVFSTTLKRECFNSGGEITTTLNDITVNAVSDTTMAWSPLTKSFGNVYLGYSSPGQNFTLTNTGSKTAVSCEAAYLSNATDFLIINDTCQDDDLAAADACTVMVQAKPQTVGAKSSTLKRDCLNLSTGVVSTTNLGLTVTGLTPIPQFSTNMTSIDFGAIRAGRSSFSREVYYMNKGNGTATGCGNAYLTNNTDFQIESNGCAATNILPGDKCKVVVKALSSTLGTRSGTLERVCTTGGLLSTSLSVLVEDSAVYPVKVALGTNNSCALLSDKTVKCWGTFNFSQGVSSVLPTFLKVPSSTALSNVIDLDYGSNHSCALFDGGDVKCWGYNYSGQTGNSAVLPDSNIISTPALALTGAAKIAIGGDTSCALMMDQTVKCWGNNTQGQLGSGTVNSSVPVSIPAISTAVDVTANSIHTCVLLLDKTVQCFGGNSAAASGLSQVDAIASSSRSTCALLNDKTIQCWGQGTSGELGNSSSSNSTSLVAVTGINTAQKIVAADSGFCAQLSDLSYKCWGYNAQGQIGDGTLITRNAPVALSILTSTSVSQLALGSQNSCALMNDQTIKCWGSRSNNALGSGELLYRVMPEQLNSPLNVADIQIGFSDVVATDSSKVFYEWGSSSNPFPLYTETPFTLASLNNLDYISTPGTSIRCGTKADFTGQCAGSDTSLTSQIASVTGLKKIISNTNSSVAHCILKQDKTVSCLGANTYGQVGNGSNVTQTTFVDLGLTDVKDLISGTSQFCAMMEDGTVKCWGDNTYGRLSLGVENGSYWSPTNSVLTNVKKISLGDAFGCALLIDKTVVCWGANSTGQIGDGTYTKRLTPTPVLDLTDVEDIVVSWESACAILTNGITKCWGSNTVGQLGDGTTTNRNSPVTSYAKLTKLASKAAGYDNAMCGINASGAAFCWGNDAKGQLGDYVRLPAARSVSGF